MLIKWRTTASVPDHDDRERRARFARNRLLNDELDKLAIGSTERASSVTNKASFLAVTAGVMVAASTSQLWTIVPALGVAALLLSCVGLVCAAVAVRPGKRNGFRARPLVNQFADSGGSAAQVEALIVKAKADILEYRELDLRARAAWVWIGFAAIALTATALAAVFTAEVLGRQ